MDNNVPDNEDPESAENPENGAIDTLKRFLTKDGWHPQRLNEDTGFQARFLGENGEYSCHFEINDALEQFFCYVLAPVPVPEERRVEAAEYLTRANYGLLIGNFEMDFEDGEVRYKSSLDFEGEGLTANWLYNAIYPAVFTMDRYHPGLKSVSAGTGAEEAISEIED